MPDQHKAKLSFSYPITSLLYLSNILTDIQYVFCIPIPPLSFKIKRPADQKICGSFFS